MPYIAHYLAVPVDVHLLVVDVTPTAVQVEDPLGNCPSRLVEGRFPKWKDVFPKRKEAIQIDISTGPMYSALRQASIVSRDESRGVDFTFDSGTVVLSGSTAEVGESRIELPVAYDSEPMTISLDHRFVEHFLRVFPLKSLVPLLHAVF